MKRRVGRRLLAIALSLCVAVAFSLVIPSGKADAEMFKIAKYGKKMTIVKLKVHNGEYLVDFGKRDKNAKKIKAKSSKKSVVGIRLDSSGQSVFLKAKKPGEAKVTFKIKKGKKWKKYTSTVKVVKYKNPLKKLMIGKKNYASSFSKSLDGGATIKDKTATIKITPRKGWKVKGSIRYSYSTHDDENGTSDDGYQKFRNGSKVTLHPGYKEQYLFFTMYNKKMKVTHEMELYF